MTREAHPRCPHCKSRRTISKGYRRTVTMGVKPLRMCKACKRKFTLKQTSTPVVANKPVKPAVVKKPSKPARRYGLGP